MGHWSFLTNHARALVFIVNEPDVRLRDLAAALDITERTAGAIVADLAEANYLVKRRAGRRNEYEIQMHVPLRDSITRGKPIGELLDLLGAAIPARSDGVRRARPKASRAAGSNASSR